MPIYAYRCSACGYQNDYLQKISDPLLSDCPECGKSTFQKQVTAAGFQLKGSGWYATDFKDNGKKPKPASKEESKSGSEKGSGDSSSSPASASPNASSNASSNSGGSSAEAASDKGSKSAASAGGAGATPA